MNKTRMFLILFILLMACSGVVSAQTTVVFPFDRSDESASHAWIGYAIEIFLEEAADGVPIENRIEAIDEMDLPEGVPLTTATRIRIAEQLNATSLITGRYGIQADRLTIEWSLFQLADRKRTAGSFQMKLDMLPAGLAMPFSAALDVQITAEEDNSPAQFERYVRAYLQAVLQGDYEGLMEMEADPVYGLRSRERLAVLLYRDGIFDEATDRLLSLAETDSRYLPQAGWSALQEQRYEEAASCFFRSLQDNQDPFVLMNVAGCLASTDKMAEALLMLHAISPDQAGPDLLFNRAVLLAVEGRYSAALDTLKNAVEAHRITDDARQLAALCCGNLTADQSHALCTVSGVADVSVESVHAMDLYRYTIPTASPKNPVDLSELKDTYFKLAQDCMASEDVSGVARNLKRILEMDPVHRAALQLMCSYCKDPDSCELLKKLAQLNDGS